jgi:hypothetical protein
LADAFKPVIDAFKPLTDAFTQLSRPQLVGIGNKIVPNN